jgi:pilus assembly protein CpaD
MTRPQFHRLSPSALQTIAASGLAVALLSACASAVPPPEPAPAPRSVTEKWNERIQVDARPDEVLLVLHAEGLSAAQAQAVDALLSRWLEAEAREIVISAPMGGPPGGQAAALAGRMADAARQRLLAMGAPAAKVRIVGYDAGGAPAAPLKVGFLRYETTVPKCGGWENLTATRSNDPYDNFGCAVTANIAAQVANPEDLLRPRDVTPADANRRDNVLGKYRTGQVTSSAKDEQASGTVAKAVK